MIPLNRRQQYQEGRGWSPGIGGLAFLGGRPRIVLDEYECLTKFSVLVGMMFAVLYTVSISNPRYIKLVDKHGGRAPPEARLPPAMFGGVLLVIGLAWFAASDGPSTHWIVSIIGSVSGKSFDTLSQ